MVIHESTNLVLLHVTASDCNSNNNTELVTSVFERNVRFVWSASTFNVAKP